MLSGWAMPPLRLSLDAPDVSLQRLVLSVDRRGDGWNEYLFTPSRGRANL